MGTRFKVIVYAPDEATANRASKAAFARIAQLDAIMSDYKASSELMQLCAKAGGDPVKVSPELFLVLDRSQQLARASDGAFDVTVGPLTKLWRKSRKAGKLPDADELKVALALAGYEAIKLDAKERTVQLTKKGMQLDLGGIAKGYAADEALRVLREHKLPRALVAAGGDVVTGDPPPDADAWRVGIAPLSDPEAEPSRFLLLSNAAVSTAGDAEQFVEIDGKRYSHIVDPKTGLGFLGQFSVTVTAKDGITADGLDTTAAALGPEKGLKLVEQTKSAAGLFLRKTDKGEDVFTTKNWREHRKKPE